MSIYNTGYELESIWTVFNIDGGLVDEVLLCVEETTTDIELLRIGVLTDDAVAFVKSVLTETVLTRLSEVRNAGVPISTDELLIGYFRKVIINLSTCASNFSENRSNSLIPSIGTIDLIQSIHLKWCGVWPFCRNDDPPGPSEPPTPPKP